MKKFIRISVGFMIVLAFYYIGVLINNSYYYHFSNIEHDDIPLNIESPTPIPIKDEFAKDRILILPVIVGDTCRFLCPTHQKCYINEKSMDSCTKFGINKFSIIGDFGQKEE